MSDNYLIIRGLFNGSLRWNELSDSKKEEPEVAVAALQSHQIQWEELPYSVKNSHETLRLVISSGKSFHHCLAPLWYKDESLVLSLLELRAGLYALLPLSMRDDPGFVYRALKANSDVFLYLSDDFRSSQSVMEFSLRENPWLLLEMNQKRVPADLLKQAIRDCPWMTLYAPDLTEDMESVCNLYPEIVCLLPDLNMVSRACVLNAIQKCPWLLYCIAMPERYYCAASDDSMQLCVNGWFHLLGIPKDKADIKKAQSFFLRAFESGYHYAGMGFARSLLLEKGSSTALSESRYWLGVAAEEHFDAAVLLCHFLLHGRFGQVDTKRAHRALRRAVELAETEREKLVTMLLDPAIYNGPLQSFSRLFTLHQLGARRGHSGSAAWLLWQSLVSRDSDWLHESCWKKRWLSIPGPYHINLPIVKEMFHFPVWEQPDAPHLQQYDCLATKVESVQNNRIKQEDIRKVKAALQDTGSECGFDDPMRNLIFRWTSDPVGASALMWAQNESLGQIFQYYGCYGNFPSQSGSEQESASQEKGWERVISMLENED
jgi:hypothetical protein